MNKILYFTNIFPSYRKELWKNLLCSKKIDVHIYFSNRNFIGIGKSSFDSDFSFNERKKLHLITNISFGRHLIWQRGVLNKLVSNDYDTAILIGDMKVLSNWIGILLCRIRKKKVALWTHGVYGNEKGMKNFIRQLFLSTADIILLYEKRAKDILIDYGFPDRKLQVVYNSINLEEQTKVYNSIDFDKSNLENDCFNLLFFGRLTKLKKVDLAINAIIALNKKNKKYKLKIVGDGPEKVYLNKIVQKSGADDYIIFEHAKYSEFDIGEMFKGSDLLISPGNVGLNAVHSICYGTPVLTHNNFSNQMPEHELIINKFNGLFHYENDIASITEKINEWFLNHHNKHSREEIRKTALMNYNPKKQVQIFESVLCEIQ